MKENQYKLDRNVLTAMTVEEADDHVTRWKGLNAASFIINQIFDVTPFSRIDLTFTDKRKHNT